MTNVDLANVFGFNAEDLAANKQGHLSETQRKRLNSSVWNDIGKFTLWIILYSCLGWSLLTAIHVAWRVVDGLQPLFDWGSGIDANTYAVIIIALPILLIGIASRLIFSRIVKRELEKGIISLISGKASLYTVEKNGPIFKFLKIKLFSHVLGLSGLEFSITEAQYASLENRQFYSVYYLPQTKIILTIEKGQ